MTEPITKSATHVPEVTFLTNYALVLLLIAQDQTVLMRELARKVGITERAIQRIVDDLTTAGYIQVTKDGRRNHYAVRFELPLHHPVANHRNVGDLVRFAKPDFGIGGSS